MAGSGIYLQMSLESMAGLRSRLIAAKECKVLGIAKRYRRLQAESGEKFRYTVGPRRGTQVVRERSAKPLYVGSIPTRASIKTRTLQKSKDAAPEKSKNLA
jgi:hypothetical protein